MRSVDVSVGGQYSSSLAVQISDCVCKFDFVLEGHNNFFLGRSNFNGEGAVCCSEICNRSAIISHSGGKVGNGIHRLLLVKVISRLVFVLVKVISRLEPVAGGSDLQFAPFLVIGDEECFKVCPCFASGWQALPGFSVIKEEASLEDSLKRDGDNLLHRIRNVAGCRIFDGIFQLVKQVFDWVIGILWCAELHDICF